MLAYLAGIMDGEGWFIMCRSRRKVTHAWNYAPRVGVGMTNPMAIEMLQKRFGGFVYFQKNHNGNLPMYRWSLGGRKILIPFIQSLLPYLRIKKTQAEVLLFHCRLDRYDRGRNVPLKERKRREHVFLKLRSLNHPTIPATTKRGDACLN